VLYKQKLEEAITYKSLLKKASFPVLVYDNSPTTQKIIEKQNFTYFHNPKNPGVSSAYNYAMQWAKEQGSTHLLLLDADSNFPEGAQEIYQNAIKENRNELILPEMLSGGRKISPFYFKWGKTWYGENIKTGNVKLGNILAINSGMLVPLNLMSQVGGFNPNILLDFSDLDFVYRVSKIKATALHIALKVNHGLSEHEVKPLQSVKFRFNTYLMGLKHISVEPSTKLLMWYWAKLKALKLCLKHQTFHFFTTYLKYLFSGN